MKEIDPNKYNVTESGQVLRSLSSEQYAEQTKAFMDALKEREELKNAYEAGKMLQYQKENGEWVDFSKNTVCDDFKFQEHLNYRIKPAYGRGLCIREHDYIKIQNYIEAIKLIAEKVKTAESDCIEQLARDVGNYLYDLQKGDKN